MGGTGLGEVVWDERLWATVWDWNTASRRVLAKLGFAETGGKETRPRDQLLTTRRL